MKLVLRACRAICERHDKLTGDGLGSNPQPVLGGSGEQCQTEATRSNRHGAPIVGPDVSLETMWENIAVAVITAVVVTGLNELGQLLRRRAIDKRRAADWQVRFAPRIPGFRGRVAIIENIGDGEARDVHLTITGDAKFEIHPDARLDICRPRDSFLVMVENVGTGLFRIGWTDARGNPARPVDRTPPLE